MRLDIMHVRISLNLKSTKNNSLLAHQLPVCRPKTEYRSLHSSHALRCLAAVFLRKEKDYVAYCCYVHSASIFPASWMNRRSFSCPKPWANTRDWMLAINKWFDFPHGLEYNKIVEIAQNSSRNTTYYELRYHTGDVFHA